VRLTVVGCSGSFAGPDSPASCYLVEADGYRLVVDLGNGALGALQRLLDLDTVDAVLLSHLHADHCVDLTGWYVQRRYHPDGAVRPPLPVYGPAGVARRISGAYDTPVSHLERALAFHEVGEGPLSLGPLAITLARVAHPVEAYAIRIEHGGRALVYSGDTGPCAALEWLATGADVLLAEASFLDGHDEGPGLHLSGGEAGAVAAAAGVGRLLVTHVPPWHDRSVVLGQAQAAFPAAELAWAGQVVDL
jgi:ribonuclease BN (tRNA processing enzyme)